MKRYRTVPSLLILIVVSLALLLYSCTRSTQPSSSSMSKVDRGAYLVMVGGCNDCHTPKMMTDKGPIPDTTRTLSGHHGGSQMPPIPTGLIGPASWGAVTNNDLTAWAGPWGVSFSYNLTPDNNTGIGLWDENTFIQTLRSGKFMSASRDILPPMPWQAIGHMTDDDLKAIFAYLKSLPPISNPIPAPLPPQMAAGPVKDMK